MNSFDLKNRRSFLKAGIASSLGMPFLSSPPLLKAASSLEEDKEFFLFVEMTGAWDVCLAFDPKDREELLPNGTKQFDQPYEISEVKEYSNGIRLAPAGKALSKYTDKMAVINGIFMEQDGNHDPRKSMSGSGDGNLPFVQAFIAAKNESLSSCPLPHLYSANSYINGFFNPGNFSSDSLKIGMTELAAVLKQLGGTNQKYIQEMNNQHYQSLSGDVKRSFAHYVQADKTAGEVSSLLDDLREPLPSVVEKPEEKGKFLGKAFASGLLGSATLNFFNYLFDTHSQHYESHPLDKALSDVSKICAELEKVELNDSESVMDKTTVVLTSEYSRTPVLNYDRGKDHNPFSNSMVLFGHKVKSPGVYGVSGARELTGRLQNHAAMPIDFSTGKYNETGEVMLIQNVWAGLSDVFSADLAFLMGSGIKPIEFLKG